MDSIRPETRFFIVLLLIAAALVVFVFFPYLNAIVLGVTLAIIFQPIYSGLLKLMPSWRGLASFITLSIAVVVILVPLIFFGLHIFQEAQGLYSQFAAGSSSQVVEFLRTKISNLAPWLNIDFSQYAKQVLDIVIANIGPVFSQATSIAATFFFAFFVLYYLLKDGAKLRSAILSMSPLPRGDTEVILSKLNQMAGSVIKGSLVIAVLQGIFVGLAFFLFGLSGPVLWGSIAVVAALIPFVGVALVVLPAALSLALAGNLGGAIGFMIFAFLAAGLIDNFLRPRLIDRDTNVHPLLVLLSVLGGIAAFGPMGFILGPLALTLFLTLLEIYPVLVGKNE
jgi:predicted PurR-regulated permease PerM